MVLHYATAQGTPVQQRDARGEHRITVPSSCKAASFVRRAPQVFTLDGAGNATCDYGQLSSLLLVSVARLSEAGAPTKRYCEWRLSIVALSRLWDTCLDIISRQSEAELVALRLAASDSPTGQRGGLITALRALRSKHASAAQLAAFIVSDGDFERIDAGDA